MGRLLHTKYHQALFPFDVQITRRHHPLVGQRLEVLRAGKVDLVVRHPDRSTMKIPRSWTDADGVVAEAALELTTELTVSALRDLMAQIEALSARP